MAKDIINQLVNVVLESAIDTKTESNAIVSNEIIQQNAHKLHKQVFVKVKVGENPSGVRKVTDSADMIKTKSF